MGEVENRICTECGSIPVLSDELPAEPKGPAEAPVATPLGSAETSKHATRKRKKSHLIVKLLVAWVGLIGLIILAGRSRNQEVVANVTRTSNQETTHRPSESEVDFIQKVMPLANANLSGFIAATAPEQRNQFVRDPIATAKKMALFYSLNPVPRIDPATLKNSGSAVLDLPKGKALETTWTSTDGYEVDAVFMEDSSEWKLDWDHFVRFSDYPWPLFLAGSGPVVGEFRLLARERLAEERKAAEDISLVFYAPRFGNPGETGPQSPEFLVSRNSEDGKLLDAAFALEKAGKRPFGIKLENEDPADFIRVRIRVRRSESEDGRKFELEKVIACHWYSDDSPGDSPAAQPADK